MVNTRKKRQLSPEIAWNQTERPGILLRYYPERSKRIRRRTVVFCGAILQHVSSRAVNRS